MYLIKTLRELVELPTDKLLQARYDKFRQMGQFLEPGAAS
jgi:acetyl-CoA carboxylase alpha subunit